MKKLVVILFLAIILTGCTTEAPLKEVSNINEDYAQLLSDYKELTKKHDTLYINHQEKLSEISHLKSELKKYEGIVSIEEEIEKLNNDKDELGNEIISLETTKESINDEISLLNNEIDSLKSDKKKITSTVTLTQGQYIVGEDIESGKYDVTALAGSGNFQGNISSLGGYDYSLNAILADDKNTFWDGEHTTYSNLRLQNGDSFTISFGLKLQFDKLD